MNTYIVRVLDDQPGKILGKFRTHDLAMDFVNEVAMDYHWGVVIEHDGLYNWGNGYKEWNDLDN